MCELLKFTKKDRNTVLLAIILIPLLIIFVPKLGIDFSNLPDNSKNFLSTSGAAGFGIFLFFLKKHLERKISPYTTLQTKEKNESREIIFTIELFEIFMFAIMPVLAFFGVITEQIKEFPYWIVIIFLAAVGIWYGVSLNQIGKRYGYDDGKIVRRHINTFGWNMIIMGVGFTILIILLESFR